jgi:hypothetical protein
MPRLELHLFVYLAAGCQVHKEQLDSANRDGGRTIDRAQLRRGILLGGPGI